MSQRNRRRSGIPVATTELHRSYDRKGIRDGGRLIRSSKERSGSRFNAGPSVPGNVPDSDDRRTPWELAVCGDLTDRQSDLIEQLTDVKPGSRGILYFDSCGGSVYTGLALATLLRIRGLRVTGIVIGECSSAALLPFAACCRRLVTRQATLLFHPMRWQSEEDVRLEEATEWARHFKLLETELDDMLSKLLQIPVETLRGWTRPGRFLTGPELAEAGVAQLFDPFASPDSLQIEAGRVSKNGPVTSGEDLRDAVWKAIRRFAMSRS